MENNRKIKLRRTIAKPKKEQVKIVTPFITLEKAMKFSSAAETGGHAKILILNGEVKLNGEVCLIRGKKLYPGDVFSYDNTDYEVVT